MNAIAYIRAALEDPVLADQANATYAQVAKTMFAPHDMQRGVRPSDLGACGLALWAQKRGLENLPRDPIDDTLARLRLGSMTGADLACLFKAGAEADSWHVELEAEPKAGGHIDALAIRKGPHFPAPRWVLEFKSQWDESGPIKPPDKDHVNYLLQGSEYAQQPDIDAPRFKVVVLKPSAPRGKRLMQFEYDTSTWGPLATQDRARLEKAIASVEPPPGDPTEKWQCVLCRYGACPKNRNKLAESVEVALA